MLEVRHRRHRELRIVMSKTKLTRKEQRAKELQDSDILASIVGRDDIEYGEHTELPKGENVALIGRGLQDVLEVQQRVNAVHEIVADHLERSAPEDPLERLRVLALPKDKKR